MKKTNTMISMKNIDRNLRNANKILAECQYVIRKLTGIDTRDINVVFINGKGEDNMVTSYSYKYRQPEFFGPKIYDGGDVIEVYLGSETFDSRIKAIRDGKLAYTIMRELFQAIDVRNGAPWFNDCMYIDFGRGSKKFAGARAAVALKELGYNVMWMPFISSDINSEMYHKVDDDKKTNHDWFTNWELAKDMGFDSIFTAKRVNALR